MNRESGEQLGGEETHDWCHPDLNFLRDWKWDELPTFSTSVTQGVKLFPDWCNKRTAIEELASYKLASSSMA